MPSIDEQHMIGRLIAPDIDELLDTGNSREARRALIELLDPEIADVLADVRAEHRPMAFRLLPRERQASVFVLLEAEQQELLLHEMATEQLAAFINEMEPDDRAELFEEVPGTLVAKLMTLLTPEERRATQRILGYPEESVGRVMTPEYVALRAEWTAGEALRQIRERADRAETVDTLFIVDEKGHLINDIDLKRLVFADPQKQVGTLADGSAPKLNAHDDQETAVAAMGRYDRYVLPVVDRDDILVGIVTADDVADVAEEEFTEDMQKMGGMAALETTYRAAGVIDLFKKRGVWLAILFCGSLLTVTAMGVFNAELQRYVILSLFVPLVIASGGNSASQASTLIIRALALGQVRPRDWHEVIRKELVSGLLLGSLLGVLGLFMGTAVSWLFFPAEAPGIFAASTYGFSIGTALVGVVLIGTITGSMLPLVLERLGIDPATSSAPFVATICDVTGLVIYFVVAQVVLGTMLG